MDDKIDAVDLNDWSDDKKGYYLEPKDGAIVFPHEESERSEDVMYLVLPNMNTGDGMVDPFGKDVNILNAMVCFKVLTDPEVRPLIKKWTEFLEEAIDEFSEEEDE